MCGLVCTSRPHTTEKSSGSAAIVLRALFMISSSTARTSSPQQNVRGQLPLHTVTRLRDTACKAPASKLLAIGECEWVSDDARLARAEATSANCIYLETAMHGGLGL